MGAEIRAVEDMPQLAGVDMIHKQFGNVGGKGGAVDHMDIGIIAAQSGQRYGNIFELAAGGDPVVVPSPDRGITNTCARG